ncbi:MAG TPA: formate dehydrogenase subunit alpha [Geminicoccaceae bacterium]
MLRKRRAGSGLSSHPGRQVALQASGGSDRRTFLRDAGLVTGAAALPVVGPTMTRRAEARESWQTGEIVRRKTVCPFCAVGCSIWAEVQNGVWIGQEPAFESPVNMGTHCAKGAATRELAIGHRRLKYPMKLVGGQWQKIGWEQAIDEIGDRMLEIREQAGPDSVYWLGSAKFSNEQAYLFRKFAAFWGTNNTDHQARICHSTTVSGVANTFGYGAMTNSFNDIHNAKSIFLIGGNPAEAHPVSMLHLLHAKENGCKLMVIDPRFTRTAAHADEYVRLRTGTDVAFMWGVLWHILENGWEDQDFIDQRVFGFDEVRKVVARYDPAEVEKITGVAAEQVERVARTFAENRPGTLIWCMGLTQSTIGNSNTRAASILQLALGNMGQHGGGTNIFRGHDNVQGATDLGVLCHTLPGYYGLEQAAWTHWARVWDVDYEWLKGRFASQELMETKGIPVSRWFDGVLEEDEALEQPHPVRAMVFWGHAPNSQTRLPDLQAALEKLDLLVVVDPVPTLSAVLSNRQDGTYLLPAGSTMEMTGSVTNSQRALQWREKVIEPMFDARSDYEITRLFAEKFGFADRLFKHIGIEEGEPVAEDITREFNRGMWTIGYTGQSPERMKLHMEHQDKFDTTTLRGMSGPVEGEYYGLPWPCWGDPGMRHPGTPILYDLSTSVAEGGLPFRARWGVERDGETLLAENSYTEGSEIKDGYPEFTYGMLEELGWADQLTEEEMATIRRIAEEEARLGKGGGMQAGGTSDGEGDTGEADAGSSGQERAPAIVEINWKTDLSGGIQRVAIAHGCAPFGNGKARALVWNFPDAVPVHREPLYTPRRDLIPAYRTYDDRQDYRLPVLYWSIQEQDFSREFPLVLTSGRLVEYEGGGDETRSNIWLAELQQTMFAEINPGDAEAAGIADGSDMWVLSPEGARINVRALVTTRVGPGTVFLPFHFGGFWQGDTLADRYPPGAAPYVLGESANTAWTYGYDVVTFMQESKGTLCRIEPA